MVFGIQYLPDDHGLFPDHRGGLDCRLSQTRLVGTGSLGTGFLCCSRYLFLESVLLLFRYPERRSSLLPLDLCYDIQLG